MPTTEPSGTCPRCGSNPLQGFLGAALSRLDNKTYVCSACGSDEAVQWFLGNRETTSEKWAHPLVEDH